MVGLDKPNYRDNAQGQGSNDRKQQRLRQRFEVVKKLGQGTYGKVQLAINKETRQEVAIKTIKKVKIENEQDMIRIRREIQIMSSIRHPYIIHIYEVFENHEKIVLITQYASGGELYDYLGCHRNLSENESRRVFRQVASAIFYCHKNKICHRDLKLENILLDDKGNAKIADFGLSNVFEEKHKLKTFCGSPLYASPEIVKGLPYCGPEVDCWSLGVLLYTLVYGAMPFDGSNFKRLVKQISEGDYNEPKNKSGASGLIRRLLTVDASRRANISDICSDWWVNLGFENSLLKVADDLASLTPVRQELLSTLSSMTPHAPQQNAHIRTRNSSKKSSECDVEHCTPHHATPETVHQFDYLKHIVSDNDLCKHESLSFHTDSVNKDERDFINHNPKHVLKSQEEIKPQSTKESITLQNRGTDESETLSAVKTLLKDIILQVECYKFDFGTAEICSEEKKDKSDNTKQLKVKEISPQTGYSIGNKNSSETTQIENSTFVPKSPDEVSSDIGLGNCISNIHDTIQGSQLGKRQDIHKVSLENDSPNTTSGHNIKGKDLCNPQKNRVHDKTLDSNHSQSFKIKSLDFVVPIFEVTSNIPQRRISTIKPNLKTTLSFDCFTNQESGFSKISNGHSSNSKTSFMARRFTVPMSQEENEGHKCSNLPIKKLSKNTESSTEAKLNKIQPLLISNGDDSHCQTEIKETKRNDILQPNAPPRKKNLVRIPKSLKLRKKLEMCNDICESKIKFSDSKENPPESISSETNSEEKFEKAYTQGTLEKNNTFHNISQTGLEVTESEALCIEGSKISDKQYTNVEATASIENTTLMKSSIDIQTLKLTQESTLNSTTLNETNFKNDNFLYAETHTDNSKSQHHYKQKPDCLSNKTTSTWDKYNSEVDYETNISSVKQNKTYSEEMENTNHFPTSLEDNSSMYYETESSTTYNDTGCSTAESTRMGRANMKPEEHNFRESARSKRRSLSRTRALSMEFENLAETPRKIVAPPKKPPGKVQIPKYFDPASMSLIKNSERREIIFIPTSSVSENKEKIEKKIEKVKQSALVIRPRRKSDASAASKKKKYVRSQTDFLSRNDDTVNSSQDDMTTDYNESPTQNKPSETQGHRSPFNYESLSYCTSRWHSTNSLDSDSEECGKHLSPTEEQAINFENQIIDIKQNAILTPPNTQHRHSVDTESGYWTPPEIAPGELSESKPSKKHVETAERHSLQLNNNNDNMQASRTAFRNSKLRLKLSDEGLDMCSLSSSIDSGIHSWKQEEMNLKRLSPDGEQGDKTLTLVKQLQVIPGNTYAPILRSCKKIVFQPEKLPTSESQKEMEFTDETNVSSEARSEHALSKCDIPNGENIKHLKVIKQSDSQCSSGSNDASDEVFENWVEKCPINTLNEEYKQSNKVETTCDKSKKVQNKKQKEFINSYSTDKESSDNDDDLDMMMDEYHPFLYGTDGLWQFLKSVDKDPREYLKHSKSPKLLCQRSKSQEAKDSKYEINQTKITRSLSKEEKERAPQAQLRHYTSEGKLHRKYSDDNMLDNLSFEDGGNYENEIQNGNCKLDDITRWERQFMGSTSSLSAPKYPDSISLYGTLGKNKRYQSLSSLNSPSTIRRKSLQSGKDSEESNMLGSVGSLSTDEEFNFQNSSDARRKLSLYGTLRTRNLNPQNRTHSQIVLNTDDGYHILYNDRTKGIDSPISSGSYSKTMTNKALCDINTTTKDNIVKNTYQRVDKEYREMFKTTSNSPFSNSDSHEKYSSNFSQKSGHASVKRRVSFSNDTKNHTKTNYSSAIHLHSLNKLREANEQLKNSNTSPSYSRDEESDTGSLLEALKEHGYKELMSQRLHTNYTNYETRPNMRISDSFEVDWPSVPSLDKLDYHLGQMPYQQSKQIFFNPTENYDHYSLNQTIRLPIAEESEFRYMINDKLKKYSLKAPNNSQTYKYQIMPESSTSGRLSEYTNISQDNEDGNSDLCDHNIDIIRSHKKSGSEKTKSEVEMVGKDWINDFSKIKQNETNRTTEQGEDVDAAESLTDPETKPANLMELLSEKIQALKFRCQRKSLDELRLQKELKNSNAFSTEASQCTSSTNEVIINEDNLDDRMLDTEMNRMDSGESVSDRILRKSFYSRINDAIKTPRRKSSFLDYEIPPDYKSFKRLGNSNLDEDLQFLYSSTRKEFLSRKPSLKSGTRHDNFLSDNTELLKSKNKDRVSVGCSNPTRQTISIKQMPLSDADSNKLSQNLLKLSNKRQLSYSAQSSATHCEASQNIPETCSSITVGYEMGVGKISEFQENVAVKSIHSETLKVKDEGAHVLNLSDQNNKGTNSDSIKQEIRNKDHDTNGT